MCIVFSYDILRYRAFVNKKNFKVKINKDKLKYALI